MAVSVRCVARPSSVFVPHARARPLLIACSTSRVPAAARASVATTTKRALPERSASSTSAPPITSRFEPAAAAKSPTTRRDAAARISSASSAPLVRTAVRKLLENPRSAAGARQAAVGWTHAPRADCRAGQHRQRRTVGPQHEAHELARGGLFLAAHAGADRPAVFCWIRTSRASAPYSSQSSATTGPRFRRRAPRQHTSPAPLRSRWPRARGSAAHPAGSGAPS